MDLEVLQRVWFIHQIMNNVPYELLQELEDWAQAYWTVRELDSKVIKGNANVDA